MTDSAASATSDAVANRRLRAGDHVIAHWRNGQPDEPGVITEFRYGLGDGSRVFSVRIGSTDYSWNERDLTLDSRRSLLEDHPRCVCGHSLGKHTGGDGPVSCKRKNCDCRKFTIDLPILTVDIERDRLDGGFVASAPRAPGCVSQGETITEALTNFADAFTDWAVARALRGLPVTGGSTRE